MKTRTAEMIRPANLHPSTSKTAEKMDIEAVGKVASAVLVPVCTGVVVTVFRLYRREVQRSAELESEREQERQERAQRRPFIANGDLEEIREAFDILMTADGNTKRRIRELEGAREEGERVHEQIMDRLRRIEDRLNRRGADAATA